MAHAGVGTPTLRLGRSSVLLALAVAAMTCTPRPPATLHALAERYVRVALQLAQHQPTLVESWIGPAEWRPGPRVPVRELRVEVDRLLAEADSTKPGGLDPTEGPRLTYLRGQLRALGLVSRRLLGETIRFDDEVALALGRPLPNGIEDQATTAWAALERELPGSGTLAERYNGFRRQFLVPADRVDQTLSTAIEACRAATAPHIELPGDQRVDVQFDSSISFDAVAQYLGNHHTRVRLRAREGFDLARLLHVACHETYPGHHLQYVLIDDALSKGRQWLEFQLTPAFGPHLLISEGAAEAGFELALPESTRALIYREQLLPAAGLPASQAARLARIETLARPLDGAIVPIIQEYLDGAASAAATADALAMQALIANPDQLIAFAERYRTVAVVYPIGRAAVNRSVTSVETPAQKWRVLQDLFTRSPFQLE